MITKWAALSSRRAETRDNAIEHIVDRARGENGKRNSAMHSAASGPCSSAA
jgi:hypothetical protein